jgi:hypothetical protein
MDDTFATEADLAAVVVAYLRDLHWDTYHEVQLESYGMTADIVAVQGPLVMVVETKLRFGLQVLQQAYTWRWRAHYTVVAKGGLAQPSEFVARVMRREGIGLWGVTPWPQVGEAIAPALHRQAKVAAVRRVLRPEHREMAAGAVSERGVRLTPFQDTARQVYRLLAREGPLPIRAVVDGIRTHYHCPSTARSCLLRWARKGLIAHVEVRDIEGVAHLCLVDNPPR